MHTNPADHLFHAITLPRITADEPNLPEKRENVDRALLVVQRSVEIDLDMGAHKRIGQMSDLPADPIWIKQFFTLLRRNYHYHINSNSHYCSFDRLCLSADWKWSVQCFFLCNQSRYLRCIDGYQFFSDRTNFGNLLYDELF